MTKRLKAHEVVLQDDPTNLIVRCLYEGLPLNIARKSDSGYMTEYTHQKDCYIHPSSVLHISMKNALGQKKSKYEEALNKDQGNSKIIYSEIVQTSKNYLRYLTDVS